MLDSELEVLFQRNHPMLNSELNETRDILHADLSHQTTAVGVNSFGGDGELFRDLLASFAFRHQLQDLALARA